jgi:hypothetical protein
MLELLQRTTGVAAVMLVLGSGVARHDVVRPPAPQQAAGAADHAMDTAFDRRVSQYATLHRSVEDSLPKLQPTAEMEQVFTIMRAMRERIRSARHSARQGDILTPDLVEWFKQRIATCRGCGKAETLFAGCETDDPDEPPPPPPPTLRVNMELPQTCFFVPPRLLLALPPLPPELRYRIVGRTLVLWDSDANLVADFLPEPMPAK